MVLDTKPGLGIDCVEAYLLKWKWECEYAVHDWSNIKVIRYGLLSTWYFLLKSSSTEKNHPNKVGFNNLQLHLSDLEISIDTSNWYRKHRTSMVANVGGLVDQRFRIWKILLDWKLGKHSEPPVHWWMKPWPVKSLLPDICDGRHAKLQAMLRVLLEVRQRGLRIGDILEDTDPIGRRDLILSGDAIQLQLALLLGLGDTTFGVPQKLHVAIRITPPSPSFCLIIVIYPLLKKLRFSIPFPRLGEDDTMQGMKFWGGSLQFLCCKSWLRPSMIQGIWEIQCHEIIDEYDRYIISKNTVHIYTLYIHI